jgi:hypothetical protein
LSEDKRHPLPVSSSHCKTVPCYMNNELQSVWKEVLVTYWTYWPQHLPIPVAARSKAWDCSRSLARTMGSNTTRGMNICLSWVLCVVRKRSLRHAGHSSRGVLPTVVCLTVCDCESSTTRRPWPTLTVVSW